MVNVRKRLALAAVVMAMGAGLGTAVPAQAEQTSALAESTRSEGYTYSCSKGGFTGSLYVNFSRKSNGGIYRINWLQYRINKGRNHGGNHANVAWWDGSTAPATVRKTSNGIQDNRWHRLSGRYYSSGYSSSFTFIFDKSRASDPRCGKVANLR